MSGTLACDYGSIEAVRGLSFTVDEGAIVALIGANGAGKSSTLRALSGLVPRLRARFGSQEQTSRGSGRTGSFARASSMSPRDGPSSVP